MAGRPLATDDAAVADTGSCQIESWAERDRGARALVVAPACGIAAGWELGGDATRSREGDARATQASLAAKWLPWRESRRTAFGDLSLGAKISLAAQRSTGAGWRADSLGLLGLATLAPSPDVQIHVNLGPLQSHDPRGHHTVLNGAIVWTVVDPLSLFAEFEAADTGAVGGTVRTAGARWWLVADRIGIDLTASRQAGSNAGARWSIGFGWYRIGL